MVRLEFVDLLRQMNFTNLKKILADGGIIAYPTEAVYGLGCDPFNETAVNKLLAIKQRSVTKGLILIAADFSQIENLIMPVPNLDEIKKTWPGPNTWVFPATKLVPKWITGDFDTVAVRITSHPIAKKLCLEFEKPLVSTSANLAGEEPVKHWQDLNPLLLEKIDYLLKGEVGGAAKPSTIRDAISGKILR